MKAGKWFVLLLLTLSGGVVHAQEPHVCGAGPGPDEVIAGVHPGSNGVAPTPLCYWKSDSQPGLEQPVEQWESRWGAIAIDSKNGVAGAVTDINSKREARKAAVAECIKRGGSDCIVSIAYVNQCAVIVAGDRESNSVHAETVEKASEIGMEACEARNDDNCRVYYSDCSLPVRVQ